MPTQTLAASFSLQDWSNVATIVGAVIALVILFYTAYQVHKNTLISQGNFWLELEKMFSIHDPVHLKLRSGGEWSEPDKGPAIAVEWAQIDDYMGLFEHCEILMSKGLIDLETFKAIYTYRLNNILANQCIVKAKLCDEKENWQAFLTLIKKLELKIPVCSD